MNNITAFVVPTDILPDLHRQVKEEIGEVDDSIPAASLRQQEIMLFQKYGIMKPLFSAEEMEVVYGKD